MKKWLCALLALLLILGSAPGLAEENLLKNGDFSLADGDEAEDWRRDMWDTTAGLSLLTVELDGYEGPCVCVSNLGENDARFAQTVEVEPRSLYRLSGMIRAEDCDFEGYGATLSIEGTLVYSEGVYDTAGGWEYVELYGRTDKKQTSLTVFARVGGYSTLSTGRAWFDNLELVKLDEAPEGATVYDFFREKTESSSANATADNGEPARNTESWLLFTCLYALAALALVRKRSRDMLPVEDGPALGRFALALAGALLIRLFLAARVRGYYADINCFTAWSERMYAVGPAAFYSPDYFCDYPPLYMLLLWLVAALRRLLALSTGSPVYLVLLKLMPIMADMAGALLVWRVARRRFSHRAAAVLGALYALNPAAIVNSAAWGQIDGVLALLIALCALCAVEGRFIVAPVCFALAALIKPQALLFAPLGLCALVAVIVYDRENRSRSLRRLAIGVAAALGLVYLIAFLCCLGQADAPMDRLTLPVRWLVELYSGTVQGYRYVTVNTLNLYYLLGLNWARTESHGGVMALAWALFALAYGGCGILTALSAKRPRRLFLTGGLLIVWICAFGPMIHERYIFPALLLLTLAFACERDARILASLTALTCSLFLNEVLVLQGGMTAANYGHLQSREAWLNSPVSILNLFNALFLAWTAWDICVRNHIWPLRSLRREAALPGAVSLAAPADYRMGIKRKDVLLMAAVTALYSVVAFTNLGVTRAPQTGWTSSAAGETVVFDLGSAQTWRMTYYGGICNTNFTVELSNDGDLWTEPVYARYNQGEIFRWIWFQPLDENNNLLYSGSEPEQEGAARITWAMSGESHPFQTSRYIRLKAVNAGLNLLEVGFLDADGAPLPVAGVQQTGQAALGATSAALLIDEQKTVAAYPSYLNSTYFDEIYHARTAYEHLHALNTYEWTHPPLGKVTMMLGIRLFGMTPFGWRFMGALVGVLMVPLMYLLVMQLTKSTKLSFVAMCLMALDSMHFTQTRIATIDSYAVFWIMLMYLFMFRYCQMSWNRESLGRTLIPLGLCGITMGVAWATKWVGIYASAGLAVLFFWTVYRRLREARLMRDKGHSFRSLWITLLFCVVFFVVVPVLIYYFSYYWMLRAEGVGSFWDMFDSLRVERVITLQRSIFSYHAGLAGDTHYFRSPWYQWPVIWWPMWYYSGTEYMPEGMISSISCMGNPAVWWFGLVALIFVLVRLCWMRRAPKRYVMTLVGFASQFLPWVLVPRSTFIYHYFASVPFIIIASVLLLDYIREQSPRAFNITAATLLGAALALFGAFYPLESGLPCTREYAQYLRWFRWYNF